MPERRSRDGWFRIGTLDVTTTGLLVLANIASMFWYAIDKVSQLNLIFYGAAVRAGDVWRVITWPLYSQPTVFTAITIVFFWFVGHMVEDRIGRKPFTILILVMTVLPAVLVTLMQLDPDRGVYGLNLLALALLVVFALDNPSATTFFQLPVWLLAAVYVGIMMLQFIGDGMYEALIMGILVIVTALVGARQYGMLENMAFIPRFVGGSPKPKAASKGRGQKVVAGPWEGTASHSPLEEAELDGLLDKISAQGMDALSKGEKARLNELSKKLRGR